MVDSRSPGWLIQRMAASEKPGQTEEQRQAREREVRLAKALRANLRRRKQAAPSGSPPRDEN